MARQLFERVAAALFTACLVTQAVAGSVAAASATPYGVNLLANGGAEQGVASSDGNSSVTIPGWSHDGNSTVVAYGTPGGFPTIAEGGRIGGGAKFITTGAAQITICGEIWQEVTLKGRSSAIDSGHVKAVLTADIGTYAQQSDTAVIGMYFYTDASTVSVEASRTQTNGHLRAVSLSRIVPVGTNSVLVLLKATHVTGYCDGYFDNMKLKLVHV